MKKYSLEDVQKAALSIKTFVLDKVDKHVTTNILIQELSGLDYEIENLDQADTLNVRLREIESSHHKTVIAELKAMGNGRWPGMYIIHDLICHMAHFGFVTRYARKDTENE